MDNDKPFSVLATHRPRRIAFLLDLNNTPTEMITAIVDSNIDYWGGRHNLIIPVIDKNICEDYWPLLHLADPDVIYCYTEIDASNIERLDRQIGPTRMRNHPRPPTELKPDFRPAISDQASTRGIVLGLRESIPSAFRRPQETSTLTFDFDKRAKEVHSITNFVHVNFGVSFLSYVLVRDEGVRGTFPSDYSNAGVMNCIAETWNLILPLSVSAQAPFRRRAVRGQTGNEFLVCFGDNAWDLAYFWNYIYFRNPTQLWRSGLDQMWLPSAVVTNTDEFKALAKLIAKKVYTSGQRQIKIVSYDHEPWELDDLAKRICVESRTQLFPGKSEKLTCGAFPAFESQLPMVFTQKQPQHHHVRGRKVFLEIDKPEHVIAERDQAWMIDLKIEDPYQERFFVNMEPWWKLPKSRSVAQLFAKSRPSRVGLGGEISVEVVASEQNIILSIPFNHQLIGQLLLPEKWFPAPDDLRNSFARPVRAERLILSDKGKYLNGLISLTGSVIETTYMFEHPFWHKILRTLCCPELSEQVYSKVSKDLNKELPQFVQDYAANPVKAKDWLKEKIVETGQRIPRGDNPLTYESIEHSRNVYIDSLTSEPEKQHARSTDLREELSQLTRSGILLQGAQVRCESCISTFWYHVDEIGKVISCRGCRAEIPLAAELQWSYQPNELLRAGMRYHGLVPVLRTLRRLIRQAHESFIYIAGAQLYEYRNNTPVFTDEVDLSWINDGQFGIAEIKRSTNLFSARDYKKLEKMASVAEPDVVLVAATDGDDDEIVTGGRKLKDRFTAKGIGANVVVWGPEKFAKRSAFN